MSLTNTTFTDANPGDHTADFTATIDWGDGTAPTTGTVSYNSVTKVYTVAGSHIYAEEGTYTPTVTVKDNVDVGGASSTTITGTATITDAPLTGSSAASASGNEGGGQGQLVTTSKPTHRVRQSLPCPVTTRSRALCE